MKQSTYLGIYVPPDQESKRDARQLENKCRWEGRGYRHFCLTRTPPSAPCEPGPGHKGELSTGWSLH